jgi:transcriptional regulator GlxA family with amidase domain
MVRNGMPKIAILTFDGFNEIDTFLALNILRRVPGIDAFVCAPEDSVRSMNGVRVAAQASLEAATNADAVVVGSGTQTRMVADDPWILPRMALDPSRQIVASQCSGALILARLGLLRGLPACTDEKTRPILEASGVAVLDRPFFADGNIAMAGGCLSGVYLAAFLIARTSGREAAYEAVRYVAPVGEKEGAAAHALEVVGPYV